jgi:pyruvate dehydrogenase E2 component (dihydrolipoamide acetyltransferase)
MGELRMPSLGADMEAGTLVSFRIQPGSVVKRGDVVAEVETEKGIVEVEIWESGVVESLTIAPGTKVPVGTVLATLRSNVAPIPPAKSAAPSISAAPAKSVAPPLVTPKAPVERVMASPSARQLARELDVDIAALTGTGPHGSVSRADVERAAASHAPPAAVAVVEPAIAKTPSPPVAPREAAPAAAPDVSAMRRAIAAAMARSKREIPHYYLAADLEVDGAYAWLEKENARRSVADRVLFAAVLLKATALALREVPEINGFFADGAHRPSAAIHVGVAISLRQGGLVAPAIHDLDAMALVDVQTALRDLVARARAGRLRSSEMSDPTVTVTNLGDQGVESVFGVIYPPQVALVGFGRVSERAYASNGMIGARRMVTATLAADHRVSDGHRGAMFLGALGRLLHEPEKL